MSRARSPSSLRSMRSSTAHRQRRAADARGPRCVCRDLAAAYEDSKALRDHIDRNARWLKGDVAVPESVGRVRAQAQVALLDMLPDGLTRRVDAADRLGLKGARRTDPQLGHSPAGRRQARRHEARSVRQGLARLPGARVDLELILRRRRSGTAPYAWAVAFVGRYEHRGRESVRRRADAHDSRYGLSAIIHDLAVTP